MTTKKKEAKSIRVSAIDEDLLTVLIGRELYGLEILDKINLERPVSLGFGSLYPALNRLEKKGLISWHWGDEKEETGGARRKYYKVTGLGEKTLCSLQNYRASLAYRPVLGQPAMGGI